MAEKKAIDKTMAARRRLALLVLSSDQPASATPCPEQTELAALVEGRLEPAREETCLAHLAGCDRCCALWLQLDRHRQEQAATGARGRLLRLVSRPRVLTVAGSLLAAAASLALVLTFTLQADRTTLTRLPEKHSEEQSRATPGTDSAVLAESGENPVAAESTQPRSRAAKREEAVVHNKIATAEPASPAAEAQPAATGGQDLEKSGQSPAASSLPGTAAEEQAPPPSGQFQPARRAKAPLTVRGWQERIRAGCTGQADAVFFAGVLDQGRRLLADPAGLNEQERHRIERILNLLTQPQPADDHCRAMLDLLGPAAPEKAP